jgi:flagellar basal body rod protein FlgG
MIRGFYTAVSGMVSSMTRQAVVADNIANANTVGFSSPARRRTTTNSRS